MSTNTRLWCNEVGLGPFFITNPVRRIVSFRRRKGLTLSSSTILTPTSGEVERELSLSPLFVFALLAHGFNGLSHDERRCDESFILLAIGDFFVRLGLGGVIPLVESDSSGIAPSCGGCFFSGDTTATASAACLDAASAAASASADSI